ncbi:uncharacterized protein METZ01_LOCUS242556, partial [marine metagenome]
ALLRRLLDANLNWITSFHTPLCPCYY